MTQSVQSLLGIKVTHANTDEEIFISPQLLFGVYYMDAHKSTVLVANGGAMLPVKETVKEVLEMQAITRKEEKEDGKN